MKTLIINNHTKHLSEIEALFPDSQVIAHEDLPVGQSLAGFDLLIISGGSGVPTVDQHPDYYAVEKRLVRDCPIPVVGICLGSEIIVSAFGGKLTGISTLHKGDMQLHVTNDSLRDTLHENKIKVYEAHCVRIEHLPKDFVVCAHSDHGIEIFKHINRPIIGIQFHPEVGKHEALWQWIFSTIQEQLR